MCREAIGARWPRGTRGLPYGMIQVRSLLFCLRHREGEILDHILLSAHGLTTTELNEDLPRGEPIFIGGALCKEEEARVDAGITEDKRVAIDADLMRHHGIDEIFSNIAHLEEVDSMLDAHSIEDGDEHFHRRVAGSSAHPRTRGVRAVRALFDG